MDGDSDQKQLDLAAQADAEEGIRQGLEDARSGRTRPARDFFDDFEKANQIDLPLSGT